MSERQIREWYAQAMAAQPTTALDERAEAELAAALFGGSDAERDAGIERLLAQPAGPALARVVEHTAADAAMLANELRTVQTGHRPVRHAGWRVIAAAAGIAAIALLAGRIGTHAPAAPTAPVASEQPQNTQIISSSFEGEPAAPAAAAPADNTSVFKGGFDS